MLLLKLKVNQHIMLIGVCYHRAQETRTIITVRERVKCNITTDVNVQLNRRVDFQTQTVALRVTYIENVKCADVFCHWASRWCQKIMDYSKTHAFENILALLIPNYWVWAGTNPVIQQQIQQSSGRSDESANRASDPKYESEPWVWAKVWAKIQAGFSWDSQLWVLT